MLNVFPSTVVSSSSDGDVLLSTLALPGPDGVNKYTECCTDDSCDNEETVVMEDSEEDLSQSPDITEDDWLPTKNKGETKKIRFSRRPGWIQNMTL